MKKYLITSLVLSLVVLTGLVFVRQNNISLLSAVSTSVADTSTITIGTTPNNTVLACTTSKITLAWRPITGEQYYNVRIDDLSDGWAGQWDGNPVHQCTGGNSTDLCWNGYAATSLPNDFFSVAPGHTYHAWADAPKSATSQGLNFSVATCAAPVNYTLTYNANGGDLGGAFLPVSALSGSFVVLPAFVPARTGYNFSGWNTNSSGTGTNYAAGSAFTMPSTNVTLYARWVAVGATFTLTYNANGGTGAPGAVSALPGAVVSLTSVVPTKPGSTFAGWNTKADGTGTSYSSGASYAMPAVNTILYARWVTSQTVFDVKIGVTSDGPIDCRASSINLSWSAIPGETYYNVRVDDLVNSWTGKWDGNPVHQCTNMAPGDVCWNGYAATSFPTGFVKVQPGHSYSIWADSPKTFRTQRISISVPANCSPQTTQLLTYSANGGTGAPASESRLSGSVLALSSVVPTWAYHTFLNWNAKADGTGTSYSSGASYTMSTTSTTLYAKWQTITFTLSYNANGGTGAPGAINVAPGTVVSLTSVVPTKPGSTFAGWNTKADGTGTNYLSGASYTMSTTSTILYAKWQPAAVVSITNCDGLNNIRLHTELSYSIDSNIDCSGRIIAPIVDTYTSLPSRNIAGNNHTISNLTIQSGAVRDVGLFSNLNHNVSNLTFINTNIIADYVSGYIMNAGVLAGQCSKGSISNVAVDGLAVDIQTSQSCVTSNQNKTLSLGGIAGVCTLVSDVETRNAFSANVTRRAGCNYNSQYIGGIVGTSNGTTTRATNNFTTMPDIGANMGGIAGSAGGRILDSINNASLVGKTCGGILATGGGLVRNSRNNGAINCTVSSGGILGTSGFIKIENTTNNGSVVGHYSGGIAGAVGPGQVSGPDLTSYTVEINDSINNGSVSGLDATSTVGGIAGKTYEDHNRVVTGFGVPDTGYNGVPSIFRSCNNGLVSGPGINVNRIIGMMNLQSWVVYESSGETGGGVWDDKVGQTRIYTSCSASDKNGTPCVYCPTCDFFRAPLGTNFGYGCGSGASI